jgi:hypothetical protein
VNYNDQPIMLLHQLTITNTCSILYARFHFFQQVDVSTVIRKEFVVAPGTTKTLGVQGLTHLGIYQMPFTNWSVWVKSKGTTPCA